jgi:hypothetical protein
LCEFDSRNERINRANVKDLYRPEAGHMGHKPINTGAHIDMSQGLCLPYALRHEQVLPEIFVFGTPTFFVTITQVRIENQPASITTSELD